MFREEQLRNLLRDKRILIAGYGREGKSTHALLQRLLPHAKADIVENNAALRAAARQGYDMIIKSPGIPTMVFEGVCALDSVTSQADLFLRIYRDKVIGVTGTKGKSTTTNLIATVLQRKYADKVTMAGNMGIPLFDVLPQLQEDSIVVCEFSCHQLENIRRAPHIAVLINLFQEHLDHYHSYGDYQMAKMNIALCQSKGDYFFYCRDNAELAQLVASCADRLKGKVESYDLEEARQYVVETGHLQGEHNLCNIEVARRVTQLLGISVEEFVSAVQSFRGLEHRLQRVGMFQGIVFYNDSISTIPAATIAAVEALQSVDTLILGGFDRGIDYADVVNYLADKSGRGAAVRNLAFVGAAGHRMFRLFCEREGETLSHDVADEVSAYDSETCCCEVAGRNVLLANDYRRIVDWCFCTTAPGKICLLSPAAASYDAFKNFEERGRLFMTLVQQHATNQ